MNIQEIVEISKLANYPTGVQFLDDLFALADTAIYYRFMFRLVQRMKPNLIVELGVCTGRCTAHLAAPKFDCRVLAIDPKPQDIREILARYPNIDLKIDLSTSPLVLSGVKDNSVDICFIDTIHSYRQVISEFHLWFPKLKVGGVMLFDDISLNAGTIKAWVELQQLCVEHVSLPHLHHSGFGAIVK